MSDVFGDCFIVKHVIELGAIVLNSTGPTSSSTNNNKTPQKRIFFELDGSKPNLAGKWTFDQFSICKMPNPNFI